MKVVSFNINGLRARIHQLKALINKHQPDIIGLQETKVADPEFPLQDLQDLGYHLNFHGQKGHYGVALMSKQPPEKVILGYPFDGAEAQKRLITGYFTLPNQKKLIVINGYFPQGENRSHPIKFPAKQRFYADLMTYLSENFKPTDLLLIMGDFNIGPEDNDIGIGEHNKERWLKTGKCCFLPEERKWMNALKAWGFTDTFRSKYPNINNQFSWFDYRSRGFEDNPQRGLRIDFILSTAPLAKACVNTGIDYEIRSMERPSDHCPVWSEFSI